MQRQRYYRVLIVLFVCLALLPVAMAGNNFIPILLPNGVRIEVPRNWVVLSSNARITIDAAVQSRNEPFGVFDASSELNFAANYFDETGQTAALMNIRYYPDFDISQADVRDMRPSDIQELDDVLRQAVVSSSQINGFSILTWNGTAKRVINGNTVFVTEYKRSPTKGSSNFVLRLVRVFNGSRSFTLTVSYNDDQGYLLRPICDRVISSLRF